MKRAGVSSLTVVRQAVRRRRALEEDELLAALGALERLLENAPLLPEGEDLGLFLREVEGGRDLVETRRIRHRRRFLPRVESFHTPTPPFSGVRPKPFLLRRGQF